MIKRTLSVFLVLVMIFAMLPANAFAANGTNLGWEYADIEETRSSSGRLTGYDLADPSASSYRGSKPDLGSYVTVKYVNGSTTQTMTQGQSGRLDGILSSSSAGCIDITCAYGYYIAWIVLCCADNGRRTDQPFTCRTVGTEDAYGLATSDSIPTHVRLNISDLYANANHDSNDDSYYLMIQLEPIPTPAYVVYDAGTAGSTEITADPVITSVSVQDVGFRGWRNTSTKNPAMEYTQGAAAYSEHTTLPVSQAAQAQAQTVGNGYSFAGWKAEYYRYYDVATNTFSNLLETGSGYEQPGDPITLYTYVKMTAIWQPKETITVSKVWDDNNNQDGLRPSSVTVYLVADGITEVDSAVLSDQNNWTHTWTVPSVDVLGRDIAYSVTEAVPSGYTPIISGSESNGFTITNTHAAEKVSISVNKVWNDSDNQDGIRPGSVTVHLLVNGEHHGTSLTLNAANNWCGSWTNLDRYANGMEISYVVMEESVEGYIPTYSRFGYDVTITNTHESELTSMTVEKRWDDAANQDGIRPSSVTIQLMANGTAYGAPVVLDASNNWYYNFLNLPKYDGGVLIDYTAVETGVPAGYTVSYRFDSTTDTYVVTNTHIPETVEVSVEKVWSDNNNQDGLRANSVTVALYKDGIATGQNAVLNAGNNWSYTFTDLAKNTAGQPAGYTVREIVVPTGYSVGYAKSVDTDGNTHCTITNTHIPEVANVTVSKVWDDANDQDGIRPESIAVSLHANGNVVQTATLSKGGNWSYTFQNLDVYADGQKIVYTVTEVVPDGYTASIDGLVITNRYEPATADFGVNKVWDDNNDQDGKRPYAIVMTLYKNGFATNYSVTLSEENSWSGLWPNMPIYENGHAISYSVTETGYFATKDDAIAGNMTPGVPEGYSVDHSYDRVNHIATITNTYEPESTFVNIQKHWEDANDQDGIRPDSVEIILYKNVGGVKTEVQRVILNDANEWDASILHLPRYEDGEYVNYTVEEVVPAGYTAQYDFDNVLRIVYLTNIHVPATVDIPVSKVWNDNNNQDGKRNDSVVVRLYANGIATTHTVTLSTSNNWSATFQDVAKFAHAQEVVYTLVEENLTPGYTAVVTGDMSNGFVITNTYNPEVTSVTVNKVWNDGNNQDNIRPAYVRVNLLADGVVVDSLELNPGNLGIGTFENLPKYNNGREIVYTVEEEVPAPYTVSYSGDAATGFIITNSYTPKNTYVTVSKVWDDNNDQDGLRPQSVVVHMTALNGQIQETVTLSAANNWTHTWSNLPMYANGTRINYTVREEHVDKYTVDYTRDPGDGNHVIITNSYRVVHTSVTVQKVWHDSNNQDGKRPESIEAALYANGVKVDTVTLSAANNWKYTWSDLMKMSNGVDILYTVKEVRVPDGYTARVEVDALTGVIELINSYDTEKIDLTVTKVWNDMDNLADIRPESVLVQLYRNGVSLNWTVRLSEENNWTYTFKNLAKYIDGKPANYFVTELSLVEGYTASYSKDIFNNFTITNTHIPALTNISVTKIWNDGNNQDGNRPEAITVNLYADGVYVSSVELSIRNNGKATFQNLPVEKNGQKIVYTVEEVVPAGYTVAYSGDAAKGFVITNTYVPETVDFTVEKVWDDENNQDGKRPASVEVHLLANGQHLGVKQILSAENGWKGQWTALPKFDGGTQIIYTVVETPVSGYVANYAQEGNHFVITNQYNPEKTELVVLKVWNDDNNRDGLRRSVEIELYANGQPTGKTAVLSAENNWEYIFLNLDKYENGKEIVYTAMELAVPAGYTASYKLDAETGVYEIINTHVSETTQLTVNKVWNDADNQDGIRPASIVVTLYADGVSTGKNVVLDASNNWTYTFENLYVNSNGTKVVYSVEEQLPADSGYTAERIVNEVGSITLVNTHVPNTIEISVEKIWDDNDNESGMRPESVTVHLLANGEHTGMKVVLSQENNWQYRWIGLEQYEGGEEITYTVLEENVELYTAVYVREGNRLTITNKYSADQTDLTVLKLWNDNHDQDGLRRDVQIELFANGQPTGRRATLSAANNWKYEFIELPMYADGAKIEYTAVELDVPDGYTVSYKVDELTGVYEIINTHEVQKIQVTVNKIWEDNDNVAGLRPENITVALYADDVVTGLQLTLSQENSWSGVFDDLDRYVSGKEIIYTVREVSVPDGYEVLYTAQNSVDGNVNITVNNSLIQNPSTGDNTDIATFLLLAVLSMAGFVTLYFWNKKKANAA